MNVYKIAHLYEQGDNIIIIPLDSSFNDRPLDSRRFFGIVWFRNPFMHIY